MDFACKGKLYLIPRDTYEPLNNYIIRRQYIIQEIKKDNTKDILNKSRLWFNINHLKCKFNLTK